MNKILPNPAKTRAITLALFCFLVSFIGKAQTWTIYDGSYVPSVSSTPVSFLVGDSWTQANVPLSSDGNILLVSSAATNVTKGNQKSGSANPTAGATWLIRTRCVYTAGTYQRGIDFEFDGAVNRAQLTLVYDATGTYWIFTDTNTSPVVQKSALTFDIQNFHTYRITTTDGASFNLYVDENTTAIPLAATKAKSGTLSWKFGDNTSTASFTQGELDWAAWDNTAAYAPGTTLPAGVTVDGAPVAPSAPVATAATSISASGFTSNWNTSATATGYKVDVATNNTFSTLVITNADVSSGTSYAASGLNASTSYSYRVRAYNAAGTSANSNSIDVTTSAAAVVPPAATTANAASSITATGFTASWAAAATATGYRLDVSTSPTFASFVGVYNNYDATNVTSLNVSGLTGGTTYYYQVRAYNSGGSSTNSNSISVITTAAAPVAAAATNLAQVSFSANWAVATTATSYKLDVSTSPTFATFVSGFNNLDVGTATTYSVTGLTAGTVYYYQVRANNASGISANSNAITVTTIPLAPTAAPTALTATQIKATTIALSWNAVTSTFPIDYYLDVATDAAFTTFAPINSTTSYNNTNVFGVTTYTVTALVAQTTYYIRIRANNTGGNGPYSTVLKVSTILETPLSPATAAASASTTTGFTANWIASASATGYYLDVATESLLVNFVSGFHNLDVSSVVTYPVTGLTPNTTYYYQVRAYNSIGTSASNAAITATTLKNNDATLKTLLIGGISYPSFSSATTTYNIGYPYPVSTPPTIAVVTTDPNASVTVTQATATPWQATAAVVAQNGTTKSTYTINFTDATPVIDLTGKQIQVVTSSNSIEIESANIISNVQVIGINGVKLFAKNFTTTSASISTQGWNTGIYIIKVVSGSEMVTKKISLIK
jgi:hypothetical protein